MKMNESRETVVDIKQQLTMGLSGELDDRDKQNQTAARNALTSFVLSES